MPWRIGGWHVERSVVAVVRARRHVKERVRRTGARPVSAHAAQLPEPAGSAWRAGIPPQRRNQLVVTAPERKMSGGALRSSDRVSTTVAVVRLVP